MIPFFFVIAVLLFLLISWLLWKSGFLRDAVKPRRVVDVPVTDPKDRKAALKRIHRWREEGKLSREEYEHLLRLCESEWG